MTDACRWTHFSQGIRQDLQRVWDGSVQREAEGRTRGARSRYHTAALYCGRARLLDHPRKAGVFAGCPQYYGLK